MKAPFPIRPDRQRGQSTVEWTGLVMLVAVIAMLADFDLALGWVGVSSLLIIALYFAGMWVCLLYTSDAADDLLCVDLGCRRII